MSHPAMVFEPVMGDELKLIVPREHPLADKGEVTLAEALQYPFVLREQGSGTRRVMEEQLLDKGLDPGAMRVVMELGSTGAVKSAVEAGLGITIISASSVKHEVTLGLLKIVNISDASFKRQFYAIHLKSTLLPISAVTFLTFLREHTDEW
ncbi:HTH-type transcriptional activator CmpR [compost metagenome]